LQLNLLSEQLPNSLTWLKNYAAISNVKRDDSEAEVLKQPADPHTLVNTLEKD